MLITFVDLLKLGNNVQSDIREFIFEHLEEHGKKVGNGSETVSIISDRKLGHLLFLSKDRGEPTDLGAEGGSDVLRGV